MKKGLIVLVALVGLAISSHGTLAGDTNGDSRVDCVDLENIINSFGQQNSNYDQNGDGIISFMDLAMVRKNYGNAYQDDVNRDGRVNVTDLMIIERSIGSSNPDVCADVDGSAIVDMNDLQLWLDLNPYIQLP